MTPRTLALSCLMTLLASCTPLDVMKSPELMKIVTELPGEILEDIAEDVMEIEEPYSVYLMPLLGTFVFIFVVLTTLKVKAMTNKEPVHV